MVHKRGSMMELGRRQAPVRWWRPDLVVLKQVAHNARDHDINGVAKQVAYHFTFAFFPTLMVLAFILNLIDASFVFARIMLGLHVVLPYSAVALVEQVLEEVRRGSSWSLFFTGLILALWSVVRGLHLVIHAVNRAYGVYDDRPSWKRWLLALVLALLLGVLLVVAAALVIGGRWLGLRVSHWIGQDARFVRWWVLLRWPAILMAVIGGGVVLYTAAPKLPISAWRALPGAVLGGSSWVALTAIFGWYITNFAAYNRVYGSIGGVIVLMLWMYVGAIMLLLGAELNGALYHRRLSSRQKAEDRPLRSQ